MVRVYVRASAMSNATAYVHDGACRPPPPSWRPPGGGVLQSACAVPPTPRAHGPRRLEVQRVRRDRQGGRPAPEGARAHEALRHGQGLHPPVRASSRNPALAGAVRTRGHASVPRARRVALCLVRLFGRGSPPKAPEGGEGTSPVGARVLRPRVPARRAPGAGGIPWITGAAGRSGAARSAGAPTRRRSAGGPGPAWARSRCTPGPVPRSAGSGGYGGSRPRSGGGSRRCRSRSPTMVQAGTARSAGRTSTRRTRSGEGSG
jgi:hypothetical protein